MSKPIVCQTPDRASARAVRKCLIEEFPTLRFDYESSDGKMWNLTVDATDPSDELFKVALYSSALQAGITAYMGEECCSCAGLTEHCADTPKPSPTLIERSVDVHRHCFELLCRIEEFQTKMQQLKVLTNMLHTEAAIVMELTRPKEE